MPNTIIGIDVFKSSPLQQKTYTAEGPTGDSPSIQPVIMIIMIIGNYLFRGIQRLYIVFVSNIHVSYKIISQMSSILMCKRATDPRVKCS